MGEETRAAVRAIETVERKERCSSSKTRQCAKGLRNSFCSAGGATLWRGNGRRSASKIRELPARHADRGRRIARDEWAELA